MGGSRSKLVNSALSLSINYNSYNIGPFYRWETDFSGKNLRVTGDIDSHLSFKGFIWHPEFDASNQCQSVWLMNLNVTEFYLQLVFSSLLMPKGTNDIHFGSWFWHILWYVTYDLVNIVWHFVWNQHIQRLWNVQHWFTRTNLAIMLQDQYSFGYFGYII